MTEDRAMKNTTFNVEVQRGHRTVLVCNVLSSQHHLVTWTRENGQMPTKAVSQEVTITILCLT